MDLKTRTDEIRQLQKFQGRPGTSEADKQILQRQIDGLRKGM